MSTFFVEPERLLEAAAAWQTLDTHMQDTATLFERADTSGLGASVRPAARSFLTAWAARAGESAAIAAGFHDALVTSSTAYTDADEAAAVRHNTLDGRLGPAT